MATTHQHGSLQHAEAAQSIPASDTATLDTAVRDLQARKDTWVAVSARERVAIVEHLMRDFLSVAPRWVEACMRAKGLAPTALAAGEEWGTGPYAIERQLRQLHGALSDIAAGHRPRIPGPVTTRPDGQVVAQVVPASGYDKVFLTGLRAEVWMEPGVTKETLPETQAVTYFSPPAAGRVALVLGAGNVSSISYTDVLYNLFVENEVVVFKNNPVNEYLGPLMEECMRALIEPGFLRVVYGGAVEGAYLCQHPDVDEVHVTGSDKTFEAIVFGPGAEGAERKARNAPLLTKRVTGELGNVSPVIIVPGPWDAADLAYQSEHITTMLVNNAGFNCNATRVIVTQSSWAQRTPLLDGIRAALSRIPTRKAYYPGAADRMRSFLAAHPSADQLGTPTGDELAWTFIPGVDATGIEDICFTTEAFCGLFAETTLDAASPAEFLDRAVAFCNNDLWGTLSATILVHPASLRDSATKAAFERAVAALRYGTVGVNYWGGFSFLLGTTPWGAFPGHTLDDIQSGTGIVHNTLMFAQAQKGVLWAPFRISPTPIWFAAQGAKQPKVYQKLTALEVNPSPLKVPSILAAALFG